MLIPHIFYSHLNAALKITILMCKNLFWKIYFCEIVYFEPQKILHVKCFLFLSEIMVGETEEKNKVFIFTIFDSFGESKM